jgi:ubiquinone/menaquinone biosynthesis C-methylase UbiE
MPQDSSYIPALSIPALTPYYDASLATIFQEQRFRLPLVAALNVQRGERVLDVGCGTATLTVLLAQHTPAGLVAGLDIDGVMLAAGQRKAAAANAAVALTCGSAGSLPYAAGSFDCAVSSLMFHHLPTAVKLEMLAEVLRVLAPDGRLLILDFGPVGRGPVPNALATLFGGFEEVGDNLAGRVPVFLAAAGFANVTMADAAFGGVLKLYSGVKPR